MDWCVKFNNRNYVETNSVARRSNLAWPFTQRRIFLPMTTLRLINSLLFNNGFRLTEFWLSSHWQCPSLSFILFFFPPLASWFITGHFQNGCGNVWGGMEVFNLLPRHRCSSAPKPLTYRFNYSVLAASEKNSEDVVLHCFGMRGGCSLRCQSRFKHFFLWSWFMLSFLGS